MQPISRLLATLVIAVGLFSGCATALSKEQVAQISSGEKPAVILDYKEWEGWWGANITFVNVRTGQTYEASIHGGDNWVGAGPALVPVEPGRYRLLSGGINGSSATATLPLLEFWFKDFEIAKGEIVNLGTFSFKPVQAYSDTGVLDGMLNLLRNFDTRNTTSYMVYAIDSSGDARIQKMLEEKYPSLAGKQVKRLLEVTLDPLQFEQVIVEAYKPDADGRLPTTVEAEKRAGEALQKFVIESWSK